MTMHTVKICGIDYAIIEKSAEEMQGTIGLANFNTQEIWIGNGYTEQTKSIARAHEVLHIMSDAYGLDLTEHQVKYLTHALIAFMADNPAQGIFVSKKDYR